MEGAKTSSILTKRVMKEKLRLQGAVCKVSCINTRVFFPDADDDGLGVAQKFEVPIINPNLLNKFGWVFPRRIGWFCMMRFS